MVILWTECGGLRGEDGLWEDVFLGDGFLQFFWIYFLGLRKDRNRPSGTMGPVGSRNQYFCFENGWEVGRSRDEMVTG